MHNRAAFTMIELIFVIVILGILAAVAIPKFAASRDDAHIAKAKATIAAVRSGIVNERQKRLFRGDSNWIDKLDSGVASNTAGVTIFDNNGSAANQIMMYGEVTKNDNGWMKTAADKYTFTVGGKEGEFTYDDDDGTFSCTSGALCKILD